ncbi:endo alpha-1,4 polygalactosaminidase [Sphingomonas sp. 36D10-4-7]|uniref:Endo alpha-1,4 polygalactosaminidase n=1 Tax=Sphingomonas corticis TaxID=2722791 RepID=A0ABX1CN30_9SPHN|nr:endo alpha-1,4 polygalactosaminidase [Sphingomonas corticis]
MRVVAGAALLALAACGAGGEDEEPAPVATATPTPAPAPSPSPTPSGTPVARWTPHAGDGWHWQLTGTVNTGYDVAIYDIDLFDTRPATIASLHAAGRRVVCYFSAGSAENWRSDYAAFAPADMGNPLDGWPGERWLDIRSANVRAIMTRRLELAAGKGCDGVEPDNVDGFEPDNRAGLPLTAADQLAYNRFLAEEAHRRGLAVALKNDLAQVSALAPSFDFAVNEQCHEYGECGGYAAFVAAGKPVLNAEYAARYRTNAGGVRDRLCAASAAEGLRTLVLPEALDDSFRFACP